MNDPQLTYLRNALKDKDWFHTIDIDQYGRYVVYVRRMDRDVFRSIPDRAENGKQVLCHFAVALTDKSKFVNTPPISQLPNLTDETVQSLVRKAKMVMSKPVELVDSEEQDRQLEISVQELTDELDRLEGICGRSILQSIFYETHDGKNAVTNLSAMYPEVRRSLERLYERYGFDVLCEEVEQ